MIDLGAVLAILRPGCTFAQEDGRIVEWSGPDPQPSEEEIAAGWAEVQRREAVAKHNAPILAELDAADLKIIRARLEGDAERVAAHMAAQAERRARLRR